MFTLRFRGCLAFSGYARAARLVPHSVFQPFRARGLVKKLELSAISCGGALEGRSMLAFRVLSGFSDRSPGDRSGAHAPDGQANCRQKYYDMDAHMPCCRREGRLRTVFQADVIHGMTVSGSSNIPARLAKPSTALRATLAGLCPSCAS